jgi:hypothetical protein
MVVSGITRIGNCADTSTRELPKWEHFAFASDRDYLDGPNLEALGTGHGALPAVDREGNIFFILKYSTSMIRCIRADGRTETIAGDDRWPGNFDVDEGPAAYFPNRWDGPRAGNYCIPGAILTIYGLPLKGEDYGRIYFHWRGSSPYKIFKNKAKNERWWFKRLGKPGGPKPPTTPGQTVKLEDVDLTDARIRNGIVVWHGNVYTFDEAKGEMTCSFTLADYEPKVLEFLGRPGKPIGEPEHYICTDDGSVYLLYFWKSYPSGEIFRMSPDRKKFEHIISDVTHKPPWKGTIRSSNFDGHGLITTWHCGPADITFSGNVLFTYSIDSTVIRRWVNGRVSSLCMDGEWRENPGRAGGGVVGAGYYQPVPSGRYIYIFSGVENGNSLCYRFGPVDFAKPTTGPLQETLPQSSKAEGGTK